MSLALSFTGSGSSVRADLLALLGLDGVTPPTSAPSEAPNLRNDFLRAVSDIEANEAESLRSDLRRVNDEKAALIDELEDLKAEVEKLKNPPKRTRQAKQVLQQPAEPAPEVAVQQATDATPAESPAPTERIPNPAAPPEVQEAAQRIAEWELLPAAVIEEGSKVLMLLMDGAIAPGVIKKTFPGAPQLQVTVQGKGTILTSPNKLRAALQPPEEEAELSIPQEAGAPPAANAANSQSLLDEEVPF